MQKVSTVRMEDKSASFNPWSQLTTVTTFDRGNSTRTTQRLNSGTVEGKQIVVTPLSQNLLIEALVKQICDRVEHNRERRHTLFMAICDQLHKLRLIEGVYKMTDLQPYQCAMHEAFERMFAVAHAASVGGSLRAIERPLGMQSRYEREFVEQNYIAGGGFGSVYKALNRLDGVEYAIKKVILSSNKMNTIVGYTAEVKAYAVLHHPNIVPYKSAWLEPIFDVTKNGAVISSIHLDQRSKADLDKSSSSSSDSQDDDSDGESSSGCTENSESEANEKACSVYESSDDENSHRISFRRSAKITEMQNSCSKASATDSNNDSDFSEGERRMCPYTCTTAYATLYIQMTLCDQTLQEWLQRRTGPTPQPVVMTIVTQIFQGLQYIHSKGIVHHDVKPSNIFISSSGPLTVQLGDFGFACRLQSESHSTMGGTILYVAPEQLNEECHRKSDVYSAGIVVLELLVPTNTRMEFARVIQEFKRGQLATTLAVDYPKLVPLVSQLVQDDPEDRPSPRQVLEAISKDKDMVIAQLRNEVQEKENIIHEKDIIIQEKDNAIAELRERLLLLEAKFNTGSTSQIS